MHDAEVVVLELDVRLARQLAGHVVMVVVLVWLVIAFIRRVIVVISPSSVRVALFLQSDSVGKEDPSLGKTGSCSQNTYDVCVLPFSSAVAMCLASTDGAPEDKV